MSVYGNRILREFYSLENLNISAERICKLSEQFLSEETVIREAKEAVDNQVEKTKEMLKKTGSDEKRITSKMTQTSNEVVDIVKSQGINKSTIQKISIKFQDFVAEIVDMLEFNSTDLLEFDKYDANKIKNSIILTEVAGLINTTVLIIGTTLFGKTVGSVLSVCISAPICEELCKQIAVKGDFVTEFTVVFNLMEASQYIIRFTNDMGFMKILKVRLMAVTMHVTTTFVQWFMGNKKIQEKMGIDSKDKEKCSTIGYFCGVIIHAIWNSLATFSSSFNNFINTVVGV